MIADVYKTVGLTSRAEGRKPFLIIGLDVVLEEVARHCRSDPHVEYSRRDYAAFASASTHARATRIKEHPQ